jgi:hypothetical protein
MSIWQDVGNSDPIDMYHLGELLAGISRDSSSTSKTATGGEVGFKAGLPASLPAKRTKMATDPF